MFGDLMSWEGSLWNEFQRMQREMDALFNPQWRSNIRAVAWGSFPAINVGSTEDTVHVYVFAPGLDMNKLDLSIQRNVLTLSGEREVPAQETGAERGYHLRERFSGSFRRSISLPEEVDADKVSATYRNGVLHVAAAKHEAAKPRQIQVSA